MFSCSASCASAVDSKAVSYALSVRAKSREIPTATVIAVQAWMVRRGPLGPAVTLSLHSKQLGPLHEYRRPLGWSYGQDAPTVFVRHSSHRMAPVRPCVLPLAARPGCAVSDAELHPRREQRHSNGIPAQPALQRAALLAEAAAVRGVRHGPDAHDVHAAAFAALSAQRTVLPGLARAGQLPEAAPVALCLTSVQRGAGQPLVCSHPAASWAHTRHAAGRCASAR